MNATMIAEQALGLAVRLPIRVILIHDGNGDDIIQVVRTDAEADALLAQYARDNWELYDALEHEPMPEDEDELVTRYFDVSTEYYDIYHESVLVYPSEMTA